jgi:hypothetical protein
MMLTLIIHDDSGVPVVEVMHDGPEPNHVVVIHEAERWTDSPVFTPATEDEQAEQIAVYRNEGYEDRNP